MNEKIFVISGNHDEFKVYRESKMVENTNQGKTISYSNFVYVYGPEVFRGWNEVHGVFYGSFRNRSDIRDIVREIRTINQIDAGVQIIPDLFVGRGLHKPINPATKIYTDSVAVNVNGILLHSSNYVAVKKGNIITVDLHHAPDFNHKVVCVSVLGAVFEFIGDSAITRFSFIENSK